MKTKKTSRKILALTIAIMLFLSAFALFTINAAAEDENQDEIIPTRLPTTAPAGTDPSTNQEPDYTYIDGTIREIKDYIGPNNIAADNKKIVSVAKGSSIWNVIVDSNTYPITFGKTDKKAMSIGDTVRAFYNKKVPAAAIYPPQLNAEFIALNFPDKESVTIDRFNEDLTDSKNQLKLNMTDDYIKTGKTEIVYEDGKTFDGTAADLVGRKLVVIYSVTARSIPAQTTPDKIIIMYEKAVPPVYVLNNAEKAATAQLSARTFPLKMIGDEIGNVLNSNIKTYIDGQRIPSYNINGKSVVLIRDLTNYGFDSFYDDKTKTSAVNFNPNKTFTPIIMFEENNQPPGTVAFKYLYTEITAVVNGKFVESFNIKGNLAIFFSDLGDYGTFFWDSAKSESRLTLYKPVTEITLDRTAATMRESETLTLTAAISPSNAANKTLTWTSSNISVVRVSNGYITAISPGTATITVLSSNGKTARCTVAVQPSLVAVNGVTLDRTAVTINENESFTLNATVSPSNASDKTLTWTSSNTSIAKVYDGYVVGISAGTTAVTALSSNGRSAICTVTVQPLSVDVTGVTLDRTAVTIKSGEAFTLNAAVSPLNATNKTLTWTSSNTGVARVYDNGYVEGISAGTATVTVLSVNGRTARCNVTVQPSTVEVSSVTFDRTTATIKSGELFTLNATVLPSDAANKTLMWTSSNINVVQVHNGGYVVGISAGTAIITAATSNGKTAVCAVTVQQNDNAVSNSYKGMMQKLAWDFVDKNANAFFSELYSGPGLIIYNDHVVSLNYIFNPNVIKDYTESDWNDLRLELLRISQ